MPITVCAKNLIYFLSVHEACIVFVLLKLTHVLLMLLSMKIFCNWLLTLIHLLMITYKDSRKKGKECPSDGAPVTTSVEFHQIILIFDEQGLAGVYSVVIMLPYCATTTQ